MEIFQVILGLVLENSFLVFFVTVANGESIVWQYCVARLDPAKADEKFRAVFSSVAAR